MAKRRRAAMGTGSVFWRKATATRKGTWVAQIKGPGGTRTRQAATEVAAQEMLRQLLAEQSAIEPETPRTAPYTLQEWLEDWVDHRLPALPIKPSTKEHYRDMITWYGQPHAQGYLSAFTPREAEAWLERVRKHRRANGEPLSASTTRGVFQATSRALDTAARDGLIAANPLKSIERPKPVKATVHVAKNTDAVLAAVVGRRIEPLVTFVAFTGCRIGEARGLKWDDVDLVKGVATIRRAGPGLPSTKTNRIRSVTLLPVVVEALQGVQERSVRDRATWGDAFVESGFIFTTGSGRPTDYRNATHELSSALAKAGLPTARPWHALRHGAAHRLLEAGIPMASVSRMLGHSSISVTVDIYGHVTSEIDSLDIQRAFGIKNSGIAK